MRKTFLFLLVLFLLIGKERCVGQNLVPNGDFEQYIGCPIYLCQIDSCLFWTNPIISTLGSSDYYNRCSTVYAGVPNNIGGFQETHSGNGYSGILIYYNGTSPDYREYIEVPLKYTLEAHSCYHLSMYVNLGNNSQYACNNIGVYFSDFLISGIGNYLPLPFTPQFNNITTDLSDTLNWTLIEGTFQATGGEKFLIIGNFKNDANTNITTVNPTGSVEGAYLYIDDVSVYKCNTAVYSANTGSNKTICKGESVQLGMQYYNEYQYKWFTINGVLLDSTNSITVSPVVTTQYVLWVRDFKYDQSYDTITVVVDDGCNTTIYIPNIFSPNNDGQNDKLFVKGQAIESLHFLIYNRWGNLVFESNDINQGWDGTQYGKPCDVGVYVYRAEITFKNGETITRRGDVTLVK
jgi:gliding motility-associated-like protein